MKARTLIPAIALLASAAYAHQGVQNPAVKARMDNMVEQGNALEPLGSMAKGTTPFDAAAAREALAQLRVAAAATPQLFAAPETDPRSEARPEIWEDFDAFLAIATRLEADALRLSSSVETLDDLRAGLRTVGQSCTACHRDYRVSN